MQLNNKNNEKTFLNFIKAANDYIMLMHLQDPIWTVWLLSDNERYIMPVQVQEILWKHLPRGHQLLVQLFFLMAQNNETEDSFDLKFNLIKHLKEKRS